MVDRAARDQYAELLRHFASGRMTIQGYNARWKEIPWNRQDPGPSGMAEAAGLLFEEWGEATADGRFRLGPEARRELARYIVFLYSDREYRWPTTSGFVEQVRDAIPAIPTVVGFALTPVLPYAWVLGLAGTVGLAGLLMGPMWSAQAKGFWPYQAQDDLDEARQRPRLLAGR